uniref:MyoD family inhibitor domain containing 2 n=1 Tax=Poecilia mexicana TaxID=48701 RepID=A0A3B3XBU1_9TELE
MISHFIAPRGEALKLAPTSKGGSKALFQFKHIEKTPDKVYNRLLVIDDVSEQLSCPSLYKRGRHDFLNYAWEREEKKLLNSVFLCLCPSVDCADIVLNCLFCRFHDMTPILPDCCQGLTSHCWPSYRHVDHTGESLHSDDDDSCVELDCGLFGNCHDASDCLELAMEVSEICYH